MALMSKLEEDLALALGRSMDREEAMKEAIRKHLDAPIWGHNHWDDMMQHGASCKTCIAQREAKELLRLALRKED